MVKLRHELLGRTGIGDDPSRTRRFPDYYEFYRRLIGRSLVIRYMGCPAGDTERIEAGLIQELGDRILWEKLKRQEQRFGAADWDAVTRAFEGPREH